jgi:hypothetical protein
LLAEVGELDEIQVEVVAQAAYYLDHFRFKQDNCILLLWALAALAAQTVALLAKVVTVYCKVAHHQ